MANFGCDDYTWTTAFDSPDFNGKVNGIQLNADNFTETTLAHEYGHFIAFENVVDSQFTETMADIFAVLVLGLDSNILNFGMLPKSYWDSNHNKESVFYRDHTCNDSKTLDQRNFKISSNYLVNFLGESPYVYSCQFNHLLYKVGGISIYNDVFDKILVELRKTNSLSTLHNLLPLDSINVNLLRKLGWAPEINVIDPQLRSLDDIPQALPSFVKKINLVTKVGEKEILRNFVFVFPKIKYERIMKHECAVNRLCLCADELKAPISFHLEYVNQKNELVGLSLPNINFPALNKDKGECLIFQ